MKYEINEQQLNALVEIHNDLHESAIDGNYAVFNMVLRLRGLIEQIEMQDVEDKANA
jgi:uncharacterized protein YicC (UPF0701 family)